MVHTHGIISVTCLLLIFGAGLLQTALGWQFPVLMVSSATCKNTERQKQDASCQINITEVLEDKNSNTSVVSRMVFSVLWGATYNDGWDHHVGGHPGLDIATAKGTPVYAIGPGKVVRSGHIYGFGNSVTVKHMYKDSYIYSSYSHLDSIDVQVGDILEEGDKIGEVGHTGNTIGETGNHLELQITQANSPTHPYGYSDCEAGYWNAVQQGSCREKLEAYTIDPLKFFADQMHDAAPKKPITQIKEVIQTQSQKYVHEISHGTIPYGYHVDYAKEQSHYSFETNISLPQGAFNKGNMGHLRININDPLTQKAVSGQLKGQVRVEFDRKYLQVTPSSFSRIVNGEKSLFIKAKRSGTTDIVVMYQDTEITRHSITIE